MNKIFYNLDKASAENALMKGFKVCHVNYLPNEYLTMREGLIFSEENYCFGTFQDEFWKKLQPWEMGWGLLEPVSIFRNQIIVV